MITKGDIKLTINEMLQRHRQTSITQKKESINFLKDLQKIMKHEGEHDNDCQAFPRYWVVMDYRTVPAHPDHAEGVQYYFNGGDFISFENTGDLQSFLQDYLHLELHEELIEKYLKDENMAFEEIWEWVLDNHNEHNYFDEKTVNEEYFIVPNTMFLTKEEAKRHIHGNKHHYTKKAHTYAMTAWRAPKVKKLLKIINEFDWDSVKFD